MARLQNSNGGHFSSAAYTRSSFTRIVTGQGVLEPPPDAIFMRVAVIGAGGGAKERTAGGGGGGCAASKIVRAVQIQYFVGSGRSRAGGEDSVAIFHGYTLIGKGGELFKGGMGEGGDFNYKGGDAGGNLSRDFIGGGAAGPMGHGDGSDNLPTNMGKGWGSEGGGRGVVRYSGYTEDSKAAGGGGTGAATYPIPGVMSGLHFNPKSPSNIWGRSPAFYSPNGGEMGGGASVTSNMSSYYYGEKPLSGGNGGLVVEWFYK